MTERTFAAWVEPVASARREVRREAVELARSLPADAWSRPSPTPGWSFKDVLAHLAASPRYLHALLRAVSAKERLNLALFGDVDAQNARDVQERRGRSVDELLPEIGAGTALNDELFARLSDEDEHLRFDDLPGSLGDFLRPSTHDRRHLEELRKVLEEKA